MQDGSYNPLGRELYIYVSDKALQRPEVEAFVDFYLQNTSSHLRGDRLHRAHR